MVVLTVRFTGHFVASDPELLDRPPERRARALRARVIGPEEVASDRGAAAVMFTFASAEILRSRGCVTGVRGCIGRHAATVEDADIGGAGRGPGMGGGCVHC